MTLSIPEYEIEVLSKKPSKDSKNNNNDDYASSN